MGAKEKGASPNIFTMDNDLFVKMGAKGEGRRVLLPTNLSVKPSSKQEAKSLSVIFFIESTRHDILYPSLMIFVPT
jgi:hypothetical protein